jgi:hypothetical protein
MFRARSAARTAVYVLQEPMSRRGQRWPRAPRQRASDWRYRMCASMQQRASAGPSASPWSVFVAARGATRHGEGACSTRCCCCGAARGSVRGVVITTTAVLLLLFCFWAAFFIPPQTFRLHWPARTIAPRNPVCRTISLTACGHGVARQRVLRADRGPIACRDAASWAPA